MAKKFLAVLLAVILAFTAGVVAFADDQEGGEEQKVIELAPLPEKQEGAIILAPESQWIEKGSTISVPVSLISDYDCPDDATADWVFVTFSISAGANGSYVKFNDFKFNSAFTAAQYKVVTFDGDNIIVSFGVKASALDILNQDNLVIGNIEAEIDAEFPGGEENLEIVLAPYMTQLAHELADEDEGAGFETEFELLPWNDGVSIISTLEEGIAPAPEEDTFFFAAACFEKPATPSWQERMKDIFIGWGRQLLSAVIAILEALDGLLMGL
ncbi:MAG: hypothetical protein KBT46_01190 [Ruminococcus sp.]|nr:hypothetical protein [Candidatus Copronaster equi]